MIRRSFFIIVLSLLFGAGFLHSQCDIPPQLEYTCNGLVKWELPQNWLGYKSQYQTTGRALRTKFGVQIKNFEEGRLYTTRVRHSKLAPTGNTFFNKWRREWTQWSELKWSCGIECEDPSASNFGGAGACKHECTYNGHPSPKTMKPLHEAIQNGDKSYTMLYNMKAEGWESDPYTNQGIIAGIERGKEIISEFFFLTRGIQIDWEQTTYKPDYTFDNYTMSGTSTCAYAGQQGINNVYTALIKFNKAKKHRPDNVYHAGYYSALWKFLHEFGHLLGSYHQTCTFTDKLGNRWTDRILYYKVLSSYSVKDDPALHAYLRLVVHEFGEPDHEFYD